MPFPIKFTLSVIVLIVAGAAYLHQDGLGQVGPKYAILFLGVFMVVAMWIFPEVNRKDASSPSRKG
jgi:hypothetical protein